MKLLLAIILTLSLPSWAAGATRYASASGSGLTCSEGSPCNILTGIGQTQAGDTLYLRSGTYTSRISHGETVTFNSGTSYANAVTIAAYPGETVTLRPSSGENVLEFTTANSYIIFDGTPGSDGAPRIIVDAVNINSGSSPGFGVNGNGIEGQGSNLKFIGLEVKNAPGMGITGSLSFWMQKSRVHHNGDASGPDHGFYIFGNDIIIEDTEIYSNATYGIHQFDSNVPQAKPSRNTYQRLKIYSNGAGAIIASDGTGNKFINNIVYGNSGTGVQIDYRVINTLVANNTIYNNGHGGIGGFGISISADAVTTTVRNNLIVSTGLNAIADFGSGHTFSHNACYGNGTNGCTGTGTLNNSAASTARFVDAANADFRLCRASGDPHANCTAVSPAIGAGFDLSGTFTTDYVSSTRAVPWDIGAHESGIGVGPDPDPEPAPNPAVVLQISCDNVVTDSSGNSNHGTLAGGATYTSGKYNAGCSFDGSNDYISVADSSSLDLTHGYTLAAWVKPSASMTTFKTIMVKNYTYYLYASSTGICGAGGIVAGYDLGNGTSVNACWSTPLSANVDTHVAATYDRTAIKLYINGTQVTSASGSAFMPAGTGIVQIGASEFGENFAGMIDEPYIKNAALSAAEVVTLMNTPINVLTGNIVAFKVNSSSVMEFNSSSVLKFGEVP
jgi:hypothetical protein